MKKKGEHMKIGKSIWKRIGAVVLAFVILTSSNPVTADASAKGEPTGYVTISVEKFTIGQGYLVEPEVVPFYEDSNGAKLVTDLLTAHGLEYENTGVIENSFYLSGILDEQGDKTAVFPETLDKVLTETNTSVENPREEEFLGEFDYTTYSGWKYTIDNVQAGYGFSDLTVDNGLKDGSVIRVQFTVYGLGADLGVPQDMGTPPIVPVVNRDSITRLIGSIRENWESAQNDEILMNAYKKAVETVSNLELDQQKTDQVEEELRKAAENSGSGSEQEQLEKEKADAKKEIASYKDANMYREEQKQELAQFIKEANQMIEQADRVSAVEEVVKTVKEKLDQVKTDVQLTQEENLAKAQEVDQMIQKIGTVTLESNSKIAVAEEAYKSLTEEQKALVKEIKTLEDARNKLTELEKQYERDQEKAKNVDNKIQAIGNPVTLEKKEAIEQARKAYDALTKEQKALVKHLEVLEAAEEAYENLGGQMVVNEKYQATVTGKDVQKKMTLEVTPLKADNVAVKAMQGEIPSTKALIRVYEYHLMKDGKEVSLTSPVTLTFKIKSDYNGKELTVLRYVDGKVKKLSGKVENGVLSVETDQLGCFAAVVKAPETVDKQEDSHGKGSGKPGADTTGNHESIGGTGVKTGDESPIVLMSILGIGALLVIVSLIFLKKKKVTSK